MAITLDLFTFSDYRLFLSDWLRRSKLEGTSNLSRLAAAVGVHTSFLAHVLSGAKNLSFEQATEISDVIGLTSLERDYFFSLIQIDRAGSEKLKRYWTDKKEEILTERAKVRSRVGEHHELSLEDRAIFYSSWLYVAVFVSTAIDDGQSLEEVAARFDISRVRATEIMNFLTRTGICEVDGNRYRIGKSVVYLTNDSPLVVKHHSNWRIQAIQKMDTRQSSELFFTSPMSMSKKDFARIREIFSNGIESTLQICKDSPAEEVVCLNIDLFQLKNAA